MEKHELSNELPKEDLEDSFEEHNRSEIKDIIKNAAQDMGIERDLSKEEKEEVEKMTIAAKNILSLFKLKRNKNNTKGENLIIITDTGVPELVRSALFEAGKEIAGSDARIFVTPEPESDTEDFGEGVGEILKTADAVLLASSKSRTHSKETLELGALSNTPEIAKLQELRRQKRGVLFHAQCRVISITETKKNILTEGAALENAEELKERTDKVFEIFKKAEKMRVTSEKGTDITVNIKPRTVIPENGDFSKPGTAGNFPFGEVMCAPQGEGTNGIYVLDGLLGENRYVSAPMKLTIKNGIVVNIEGDEKDVSWLKNILDSQDKKKGNPYKVAEASIGTNSKAFRIDENGKQIFPPDVVEAEKLLGTVHFAIGNNKLFLQMGGYDKNDIDYNDVDVHMDFPIYDTTVEMIMPDGEKVVLVEKGKLMIGDDQIDPESTKKAA